MSWLTLHDKKIASGVEFTVSPYCSTPVGSLLQYFGRLGHPNPGKVKQ